LFGVGFPSGVKKARAQGPGISLPDKSDTGGLGGAEPAWRFANASSRVWFQFKTVPRIVSIIRYWN